jgi:hypothetical protein
MVSHLFGGRDLLESKLTILVFYITKEPVDRYPLPTLWNWIVRLEGMEGISLEECRDRMVVYDPLCQDDQDKTSLTALLRKVTPVGENAFQTSLSTSTELRHVVKIKNGRSRAQHIIDARELYQSCSTLRTKITRYCPEFHQ